MDSNCKVITLCGSIKFKEDFLREQERLTLMGYVVLMPVFFDNTGEEINFSDNIKQMLGNIHRSKIDMADEIFVINKNGYIGASTKAEIEYAIKKSKKVNYMGN